MEFSDKFLIAILGIMTPLIRNSSTVVFKFLAKSKASYKLGSYFPSDF